MIGISRLYCAGHEQSDNLRYRSHLRVQPTGASPTGTAPGAAGSASVGAESSGGKPGVRRPVVVWNCTARCNLACSHCYSSSCDKPAPDEMSTAEGTAFLKDLSAFGAPVVLFSGGEPLLRPDIMEMVALAAALGLRAVLSTNGTLITPDVARRLADAKLAYAGISLDGLRDVNDSFRGRSGAFDLALAGVRNCLAAGVKVGLRLTMNRRNVGELGGLFDLIEREGVPRACFYHLAYTGRGGSMSHDDLSHEQTRSALDLVIDRTARLHANGKATEILTVDNHADGPYLYMRMLREGNPRTAEALELLRAQGGNSSGSGIGAVAWNGAVMPDQFWRQHVVGNVRTKPFSEIWSAGEGLLAMLRDRQRHLKCRCQRCRWLGVCNGNLRARAEAATGDPWGDDPACYLSDDEIAPDKKTTDGHRDTENTE